MTRKHVDKDYSFGGWNGAEILSPKICIVCNTVFTPKSGIHKFCSLQCKGKWKYITGSISTEYQYKEISGNWLRYFSRLASQKHRQDLTASILLEVYDEQNGLCALSGEPLTCVLEKGTICKTNASIDRIVAGGPYTKDNVQLVCRALNLWRGDTDLMEFIEWCNKVSKFHNEEV